MKCSNSISPVGQAVPEHSIGAFGAGKECVAGCPWRINDRMTVIFGWPDLERFAKTPVLSFGPAPATGVAQPEEVA